MTKNMIVAAGLAGILAIGTCACSFSSESSTTVSTSTTDEDGNTTETTTTTTTSDGTSTNETTTSETSTTAEGKSKTEATETYKVSDWKNAWMGKTDKGFNIYYAESDNADAAFIVFYNADTGTASTRTGDLTNPETGIYTIDYGDATFTYSVQKTDDKNDNMTVNFGDEYGAGDLQRTDIKTLIQSIRDFDPEGKVLAS